MFTIFLIVTHFLAIFKYTYYFINNIRNKKGLKYGKKRENFMFMKKGRIVLAKSTSCYSVNN